MPQEAIHLTPRDIARFEAKFVKVDGCWNWTASRRHGYGQFSLGGVLGTMEQAHRVAYTLYIGVIPDGMCILHSCDNPSCVNPQHLWVGSRADNNMDRDQKDRCKPATGERCATAKLTAANVLTILRLAQQPRTSQRSLGRRFGVNQSGISRIINRKRWVTVTGLTQGRGL